jgi:hypothetical protein
MIPLFAVIRIRNARHRFGLWLPLCLLWLLVLPLVLVLLPFFVIACLIISTNPFRVLAIGWRVLSGLAGTHIEIEKQQTQEKFLVRII